MLKLLRSGSRFCSSCLHRLSVAIRTYNNAVFLVESSPILNRNPLYRKPFASLVVCVKLLTTNMAHNDRAERPIGALIEPSVLDTIVIKLSGQDAHLPFTGWLPSPCNPNDSCYIVSGKPTDVIIVPHRYQFDSPNIGTANVTVLNRPVYCVEDLLTEKTVAVADDFGTARNSAESYYNERIMSTQMGQYP